MNKFQQNLKRHFEELYVRKNLSKELVAHNSKQLMEISQGKVLLDMQIEQGLKFLEVYG